MNLKKTVNAYWRFLILLGITILFALLFSYVLDFYLNDNTDKVYEITSNNFKKETETIFQQNSKNLTDLISILSNSDELVDAVNTKNTKYFDSKMTKLLEYNRVFVGAYNLDKKLIFYGKKRIRIIDFVPEKKFSELYINKHIRYYVKNEDGIFEVFGTILNASNDPAKEKAPLGYLFLVRILDQGYVDYIGNLTHSKTQLLTDNASLPDISSKSIRVEINIKDTNNKDIAKLFFERDFDLNFSLGLKSLLIVLLLSVLSVVFLGYLLNKWFFDPLKIVTSFLENGDRNAINKLKKYGGEFRYISKLFQINIRQKEQLILSRNIAEENGELKSAFLANLSHEIRTPMNAIVGFSDLIRSQNISDAERDEYLTIINKSGHDLVFIIEDLIEMSKIDANQVTPKIGEVDVDKCFKELQESIAITIPRNKKIELHIIPSTSPPTQLILTDEIKLKQIMLNLIGNAIKFTDFGTVSFGYEISKVDQTIKLTVKDSGKGITKEGLQYIFDRFRTVDSNSTSKSSGLGLGLAISKAYIQLLGGTVIVDSVVGLGTMFVVTLPFEYAAPKSIALLENKNDVPVSLGNEIILIAEDNDINFILFKKILNARNYTILRAKNGQEAVDICNGNQEINLVFMDIEMPIMDGIKAFENIKKIKPNLSIIAQTAHASIEDEERILSLGFDSYITKPLKKEKIFELLDDLL
ncbi:ATP-binding protein [Flavobacterium taihuense]|uniref:histidine kinase n=1 Tax=Flavobacterium taihuense TaxID=2857508 RepID=A0ABS6Y0N9_9FLAO|nr:ATP-binding protein [Flavobacterium taihuense]MBW4362481.1 response regulator [Flavobacterium taihuense]